MKKSELFKILAIASMGAFAYHVSKEKGKQLSGDPGAVVDKIMPWLQTNPHIRPFVRMGMYKVAEQLIKDKKNVSNRK